MPSFALEVFQDLGANPLKFELSKNLGFAVHAIKNSKYQITVENGGFMNRDYQQSGQLYLVVNRNQSDEASFTHPQNFFLDRPVAGDDDVNQIRDAIINTLQSKFGYFTKSL